MRSLQSKFRTVRQHEGTSDRASTSEALSVQIGAMRQKIHSAGESQGATPVYHPLLHLAVKLTMTKSHQNKFHAIVLRDLTRRFASLRQGNVVSLEDKELWDYFSTLYRHSNKGIKGRGKDRRIVLVEEPDEQVKTECDGNHSHVG